MLRGLLLNAAERGLAAWLQVPLAAAVAVALAAGGAGVLHLYQGPRAAVIISQLSVLFGLLFVISGHNLWALMLCHGAYDTIAFVRFGVKTLKYAKPEGPPSA